MTNCIHCGLVVLFVCLQPSSSPVERFTSDDNKFSFALPAGWQKEKGVNANTAIKLVRTDNEGRKARIAVSVLTMNEAVDLSSISNEQLAEAYANSIGELGERHISLGFGRSKVASVAAIWSKTQLQFRGGKTVFQSTYEFVHRHHGFTVKLTVDDDRNWFDENQLVFDTLISSFRFDEAKKKLPSLPSSTTLAVRTSPEFVNDGLSALILRIAQDSSLDKISATIPKLRVKVNEARLGFNKQFRDSLEGIEEFVRNEMGPDFDKTKNTIVQEQKAQMSVKTITFDDAVEYIDTVNRRAKGELPQRIYIVLAAFHPLFMQLPHQEFAQGFVQEYKSDGSGKALGLKPALQIPLSWKQKEGRRPHILCTYSTHDSFCSVMLYVKKLTLEGNTTPLDEILRMLSSKEYLAEEQPEAQFVANGMTVIASFPASYLDSRRLVSRSLGTTEIKLRMRNRIYYLIVRDMLVSLSFSLADSEGRPSEYLENEFKRHEVLFDLIATSLDFYDKYE